MTVCSMDVVRACLPWMTGIIEDFSPFWVRWRKEKKKAHLYLYFLFQNVLFSDFIIDITQLGRMFGCFTDNAENESVLKRSSSEMAVGWI